MRLWLFSSLFAGGLVLSFCGLPAHAQMMFSQDLHDQSRWRGGSNTSSQQFFGRTAMDSASAFFQRRDEEDRERREMLERQRRRMDNSTNLPDHLRETYPRRADGAYNWR
jgi:hypothetical protein